MLLRRLKQLLQERGGEEGEGEAFVHEIGPRQQHRLARQVDAGRYRYQATHDDADHGDGNSNSDNDESGDAEYGVLVFTCGHSFGQRELRTTVLPQLEKRMAMLQRHEICRQLQPEAAAQATADTTAASGTARSAVRRPQSRVVPKGEQQWSLSMELLRAEYQKPAPGLACPFCVYNRQMRTQHAMAS